MSALLVCRSWSHGNTAKVADAIAGVLGAEVVEPWSVEPESVAEYDLAGFGSGIYEMSFDRELEQAVEAFAGGDC